MRGHRGEILQLPVAALQRRLTVLDVGHVGVQQNRAAVRGGLFVDQDPAAIGERPLDTAGRLAAALQALPQAGSVAGLRRVFLHRLDVLDVETLFDLRAQQTLVGEVGRHVGHQFGIELQELGVRGDQPVVGAEQDEAVGNALDDGVAGAGLRRRGGELGFLVPRGVEDHAVPLHRPVGPARRAGDGMGIFLLAVGGDDRGFHVPHGQFARGLEQALAESRRVFRAVPIEQDLRVGQDFLRRHPEQVFGRLADVGVGHAAVGRDDALIDHAGNGAGQGGEAVVGRLEGRVAPLQLDREAGQLGQGADRALLVVVQVALVDEAERDQAERLVVTAVDRLQPARIEPQRDRDPPHLVALQGGVLVDVRFAADLVAVDLGRVVAGALPGRSQIEAVQLPHVFVGTRGDHQVDLGQHFVEQDDGAAGTGQDLVDPLFDGLHGLLEADAARHAVQDLVLDAQQTEKLLAAPDPVGVGHGGRLLARGDTLGDTLGPRRARLKRRIGFW